jgi:hypothetical protein
VLRTDISILRQEVRTHHASVVGHGIGPSDREERIERLDHAAGSSSPNP